MVDGPQRVDRMLESSVLVRANAPTGDRPPAGTTTVAAADQGSDGGTVDADDYAGANFDTDERGLYALQKADLVNLICLPPPTPGGELPADLWPTAAAYAVTRRAFLIVDPPPVLDARAVADWPAANGLSGEAMRNAALYYPRIKQADPLPDGARHLRRLRRGRRRDRPHRQLAGRVEGAGRHRGRADRRDRSERRPHRRRERRPEHGSGSTACAASR